MMAKHSGLGKGLEALIPTGEKSPAPAGGVMQVPVELISPNPHQPRVHFDEGQLAELADSIREHGIIQPLIVSPGESGRFTLIAGERRLQAAQKAGLQTVPVIARHAEGLEMLELALIENVQRADLNVLEEAEAYRHLTEEFGLSHEAVAVHVGRSRTAVTNTLRLLDASAGVKQALVDGKIREGHARALLGLPTAKAQDSALRTVIEFGMSVRQTENLVKRLRGARAASKKKPAANADISDLQNRLEASLGTKVSLRHGKKGGTVTIHYYSSEELEALLGKLL
jgi:ParB family chromosome partitioning protein